MQGTSCMLTDTIKKNNGMIKWNIFCYTDLEPVNKTHMVIYTTFFPQRTKVGKNTYYFLSCIKPVEKTCQTLTQPLHNERGYRGITKPLSDPVCRWEILRREGHT